MKNSSTKETLSVFLRRKRVIAAFKKALLNEKKRAKRCWGTTLNPKLFVNPSDSVIDSRLSFSKFVWKNSPQGVKFWQKLFLEYSKK